MKKDKGSISVFVLVALLFMSAFLIILYANNVNKSKIAKEQFNMIESIYQGNFDDINEIHNKLAELPVIENLPTPIIEGYTEIKDSYVDYDTIGGETEYNAFDEKFANLQEIINYVVKNNRFGAVEIKINAKSNNGKNVVSTQNVEIIEAKYPIINKLPNPIITNITKLESSYVEYDFIGGETEYFVFNTKFASIQEVVDFVIQNNKYEEIDIVIKAKGKNNKTTTSTQRIEFIRGMLVRNETELNTALKTTGDLYVVIANDIVCSSIIDNINNINHKIDLNNSTISYTKQNESFVFLTFGANSKVTIFDSSSEKQGKIIANLIDKDTKSDGQNRKNSIYCIKNYGILNIESGTIATNLEQTLIKKASGSGIDDKATTIDNFGTVNLNGGNITTNVHTSAVVWAVVVDSVANATGIFNANNAIVNLNTGTITTRAEASMQMAGMVYGRTYANAYGIENAGSINNSNKIVFTTTAIANTGGTFDRGTDKADIK